MNILLDQNSHPLPPIRTSEVFPPEVQCVIFEKLIGSSLNFHKPTDVKCSLNTLLLCCLVCSQWNQILSPLSVLIAQDPIGWSIQYEKQPIFKEWLKKATSWANDNHPNKPIEAFIKQHRIKPIKPCTTKGETFSFAVFSALGQYHVSEDFLKFVWLEMHQNRCFQTLLGDYYRTLVYNGNISTIEWLAWTPTGVPDKTMREMLLQNNTAAHVRYYLERFVLWTAQEYRYSVLWEPLLLAQEAEKVFDLEKRGVPVPWSTIRERGLTTCPKVKIGIMTGKEKCPFLTT